MQEEIEEPSQDTPLAESLKVRLFLNATSLLPRQHASIRPASFAVSVHQDAVVQQLILDVPEAKKAKKSKSEKQMRTEIAADLLDVKDAVEDAATQQINDIFLEGEALHAFVVRLPFAVSRQPEPLD